MWSCFPPSTCLNFINWTVFDISDLRLSEPNHMIKFYAMLSSFKEVADLAAYYCVDKRCLCFNVMKKNFPCQNPL